MLNPEDLKNPEVIKFLEDHENHDPFSLMLKAKAPKGTLLQSLVSQIQSKQKAKKKLPEWFNTKNILFPSPLSMEQCSSEATAKFKADLFSGESFIDITGGSGVDMHYMAQNFKKGIYIEQNTALFRITKHNFELLEDKHLDCINTNSLDFIKEYKEEVNLIYLDPARRSDSKKKVFLLEDCSPNILDIKKPLFEISPNILLKASPMLDISQSIKSLQNIQQIWVVSYDNECKELLFHLNSSTKHLEDTVVSCINIKKNGQTEDFTFKIEDEKNTKTHYSQALTYLYEANSSITKAGAFNLIAKKYSLFKLDKNTHLYTSEKEIDFPGKVFKIIASCKYDKKSLSKEFPESKFRILLKNFPQSISQIKNKLKIKEGGENYLICCTVDKKPLLIICEKLN